MIGLSVGAGPVAIGVAGLALLAASVSWASHDSLHPLEMRVFRAVNRRWGGWYWPLWLPMQFGNLVVGTVAGVGVAVWLRDVAVGVATVIAAVSKIVVERVIRQRMAGFADVRQRPGTSEPDAVLRGSDVPVAGASFPSGHIVLAAAIASVLSTAVPLGWVLLVWCLVALVMVGRVYVGAHNPLDVTAGLGAGMLIGGVLSVLLR